MDRLFNFLLTTLASVLIFTSSMVHAEWTDIFDKAIKGSGEIKEKTFDVKDIDEVELPGTGKLILIQASQPRLTVKTDDNLLDYYQPQYEDDALVLKSSKKVAPTQDTYFTLQLPSIKEIKVSGSGDVDSPEFKTKKLELTINGSGDIHLNNLQLERLETTINGSGYIQLSGQATDQSIVIRGSGKYQTQALKTQSTKVTIYGSGTVHVQANKNLDVKIYGAGTVHYTGDAKLTQSIKGAGKLLQVSAN